MTPRALWLVLVRAVLVALCLAVFPRAARAQMVPPDVTLRADADDVEVGDSINLTLSALADATTPQPSDPSLKAIRGARTQGPFVSSRTAMLVVNGRVTRRSGFDATWLVQPSAPGVLELGPVTFQWNGRRVSAGSVRVLVKPAGTRPKLRGRGKPDPLSGLLPFPFGLGDDDRRPEPEPQADPQLSLDAPLDPSAFLRAVVDKSRATVGEQVTLSVYLYVQPRVYQPLDPHEPSAPDFFQRVISGGDQDGRVVTVGGQRWNAQLLRRVALFPLHAGDLTIEPMSVTLLGPGFHGAGMRGGMVRATRPITIQAVEPPAQGRPAGYALGDVGTYTLAATVEPRTVEAGGSVAVTAILRGTGNVPASVRLPERRGVEWLEAETREAIDVPNGIVAGARSFTWVVKADTPGKLELGELTLPFYDAKRGAYDVARAVLGTITVTGAPPPAASSTPARDPFAAVAPAHTTLDAWSPPPPPWTDASWFWALVCGAPLSVLAIEGATRGGRALLARRRRERSSAAAQVNGALVEATAAAKANDGKRAASAVERAVVIAVEGAVGLRIRGLLREEVRAALVREGVDDAAAAEVEAILRDCDAWRFVPGETPPGDPVARARSLARQLGRRSA